MNIFNSTLNTVACRSSLTKFLKYLDLKLQISTTNVHSSKQHSIFLIVMILERFFEYYTQKLSLLLEFPQANCALYLLHLSKRMVNYFNKVIQTFSLTNLFVFSKGKVILGRKGKVICVKIPGLFAKHFVSKYSIYKTNAYLYECWCFVTGFPITCRATTLIQM